MSTGSLPRVTLPDEVAGRAIGMARAGLPNEACGLVAGSAAVDWAGPSPIELVSVVPVANALGAPDAFALDGQGMIDAEAAIDAAGHVPVGVYHSHPTSEARPSARDVADAGTYDPEHRFVHVIVSLQGFAPMVRVWRFGDSPEECSELEVVSVGGDTNMRGG